jgi:hypothetical protein
MLCRVEKTQFNQAKPNQSDGLAYGIDQNDIPKSFPLKSKYENKNVNKHFNLQ